MITILFQFQKVQLVVHSFALLIAYYIISIPKGAIGR